MKKIIRAFAACGSLLLSACNQAPAAKSEMATNKDDPFIQITHGSFDTGFEAHHFGLLCDMNRNPQKLLAEFRDIQQKYAVPFSYKLEWTLSDAVKKPELITPKGDNNPLKDADAQKRFTAAAYILLDYSKQICKQVDAERLGQLFSFAPAAKSSPAPEKSL